MNAWCRDNRKNANPKESAIRRAGALAAKPEHAGALAFKRSGDPNLGHFGDATVLRTFGLVPDRLDEF